MNKLQGETSEIEFNINSAKTEVMLLNCMGGDVNIVNNEVEQAEEVIYLGRRISVEGGYEQKNRNKLGCV